MEIQKQNNSAYTHTLQLMYMYEVIRKSYPIHLYKFK